MVRNEEIERDRKTDKRKDGETGRWRGRYRGTEIVEKGQRGVTERRDRYMERKIQRERTREKRDRKECDRGV